LDIPSTDSVTREAAMAPWIVIHHSNGCSIKGKRFFTDLFSKPINDGFINSQTSSNLFWAGHTNWSSGNLPLARELIDPIEKINGLIEALNLKKINVIRFMNMCTLIIDRFSKKEIRRINLS